MTSTEATQTAGQDDQGGEDSLWLQHGKPSRSMSSQDYRAWVRREVARQVFLSVSAVLSGVGLAGIGVIYSFLSSQIGTLTNDVETRVAKLEAKLTLSTEQLFSRVEALTAKVSTDVEVLTSKLSSQLETQANRTEQQLGNSVEDEISFARREIEDRLPSMIVSTLAREKELAGDAVNEIVSSIKNNNESTEVIVDAVRQKLKESDEIQQILLERANEIVAGNQSDNMRTFALSQIILYASDEGRNDYLAPVLLKEGDVGSAFELALTTFQPSGAPGDRKRESDVLDAVLRKMFNSPDRVEGKPTIYIEFLSRFGSDYVASLASSMASHPENSVVGHVLKALLQIKTPQTVDYLVNWVSGDQPALAALGWRGLSTLQYDYVNDDFDNGMRQEWARKVWQSIETDTRSGQLTSLPLSDFFSSVHGAIRSGNAEEMAALSRQATQFGVPQLANLVQELAVNPEMMQAASGVFASPDDIIRYLDIKVEDRASDLGTRTEALGRLLSPDPQKRDWEEVVQPSLTGSVRSFNAKGAHDVLLTAWQQRLRVAADDGKDIQIQADKLAEALSELDEKARSNRQISALYYPPLADALELSMQYASSEHVLHFLEKFFVMHDYAAERGEVSTSVGHRPLAAALTRLWELQDHVAIADNFVENVGRRADNALREVLLTAFSATMHEAGLQGSETRDLVQAALASRDRDLPERARGIFCLRVADALSRAGHDDILDALEVSNVHLVLPQWVEQENDGELRAALDGLWGLLEPRTLRIEDFRQLFAQRLTGTAPLTIDWRSPDADQTTSEQYAWLSLELDQGENYYLSFSDVPVRYAVVSEDAKFLSVDNAQPGELVALSDIAPGTHSELYIRLHAQKTGLRDTVQLKTAQPIYGSADARNPHSLDVNTPYKYKFSADEQQVWFTFHVEGGKTYGVETSTLDNVDTVLDLFRDPADNSPLDTNDDIGDGTLASYIEFKAETGRQMAVKVKSYEGPTEGSFGILVKEIDLSDTQRPDDFAVQTR